MASIEQTEAGDNKRGLKIIPAQPRSGVCNHAHTAVGHGPAGWRLHITHTATGDHYTSTATVCRDYTYTRVHKSPHKFMLTSYMKYFAKFLALLLHNTSFLQFYFIFNNS